MKTEERKRARPLRSQGWSLRAIVKEINCSKSCVSKWIWDIPLTEEQVQKLHLNWLTGLELGRIRAASHPNGPREKWSKIRSAVEAAATSEIKPAYSHETLMLVGAALYWAEGYKKGRNVFSFANTEPKMIKLMMKFLREICGVPEDKFRGVVRLHPHLDVSRAEKYWSDVSDIPLAQFHKTQLAVSRASRGKRDTLPFGTFCIVISDTRLLSRIKGWISGLGRWAENSTSVHHAFMSLC